MTDSSRFLKAVEVQDDILKLTRDIEVEIFGEEQSWSRGESNVTVSMLFNWLIDFLFCLSWGCLKACKRSPNGIIKHLYPHKFGI